MSNLAMKFLHPAMKCDPGDGQSKEFAVKKVSERSFVSGYDDAGDGGAFGTRSTDEGNK